jgi:hypothetical protein
MSKEEIEQLLDDLVMVAVGLNDAADKPFDDLYYRRVYKHTVKRILEQHPQWGERLVTNPTNTSELHLKVKTVCYSLANDILQGGSDKTGGDYADEIMQIFAAELEQLLEQKEHVEYPHNNYGDYEGKAIPVSAIEQKLAEIRGNG